MRWDLTDAVVVPPVDVKRRIAHHIVKPDIRLIAADVSQFQMGGREEVPGYFVCLGVQLAAVGIGFGRNEIEKAALAAGEIGHKVCFGQLQARHHKLADGGRCEKLPVFDLFLGLAVGMVIGKVFSIQPVQAAIARIGVEEIFRQDTELICTPAVN